MTSAAKYLLAGVCALSLQLMAAQAAEEPKEQPPAKPMPLSESVFHSYIDVMATGKDGAALGMVYDIILGADGKPDKVVVEVVDDMGEGGEEGAAPDEAAADEEPMEGEEAMGDEEPMEGEEAMDDEEPAEGEEGAGDEAAGAEAAAGAEEEAAEEPIGRLVAVEAEGAIANEAEEAIQFPSLTKEAFDGMSEFSYEAGMKSVAYPDGYPAEEEPAAEESGE